MKATFHHSLSNTTLIPFISAFRALINSIVPETASDRGGNLAPEALEKLSGKLRELIGDDALKDFNQQRNERGEVRLIRIICTWYYKIPFSL